MRRIFIILAILLPALVSCTDKDGSGNTEEPVKKEKKEDFPNPEIEKNPVVDYTKWEIKDGKFFLDGKWVFLKIGKPLIWFSEAYQVDALIPKLETYRNKYFNTIEINCYWHLFDKDGDGTIDVSLDPLNKMIEAVYNMGMYPCLSVETYSVGGGSMPAGFWDRFPDAYAIDEKGNPVKDTEYGFNTQVVSLFHQGYRDAVHKYIKNLAKGINTDHILWFETTCEPQYMGTIPLCYSESARKEYDKWRAANGIEGDAMPETFPIPDSFINNANWNKFRAQWLAKWVNEDAAAWREVAGKDAYVAVDYLETGNPEMYLRNGDSKEFLRRLTCANIIQVNHHWALQRQCCNTVAYDNVHEINEECGRNWVIGEHMTFNGDDFRYNESEAVLENTLKNGTRMGWEFTNIVNDSGQSFCLYTDNFTPKGAMRMVDNYWGWWLHRVARIEENAEGYSYKK